MIGSKSIWVSWEYLQLSNSGAYWIPSGMAGLTAVLPIDFSLGLSPSPTHTHDRRPLVPLVASGAPKHTCTLASLTHKGYMLKLTTITTDEEPFMLHTYVITNHKRPAVKTLYTTIALSAKDYRRKLGEDQHTSSTSSGQTQQKQGSAKQSAKSSEESSYRHPPGIPSITG